MADQALAQAAPMVKPESAGTSRGPAQARSWTGLWQLPAILGSIILLAGVFLYGQRGLSPHRVVAILEEAKASMEGGRLDHAISLLNEEVLRGIEGVGSEAERGRLHAMAADAILVFLEQNRSTDPTLLAIGVEHSNRAARHGWVMQLDQIERLGAAECALGQLDSARGRLAALAQRATEGPQAEAARAARRRLLRVAIDLLVDNPRVKLEDAISFVEAFRAEPTLTPADEFWAAVNWAKLAIEDGRPAEAIEELVPFLSSVDGGVVQRSDRGGLLALRARALFSLGDLDSSLTACDIALRLIESQDPRRADALVIRAEVLAAQSRFLEALHDFSAAAAEFPGDASHAAALLGMADMRGMLGDVAGCQRAYLELAECLRSDRTSGRVTAEDALRTLAQRQHDAAIAVGDLRLACEYIALALLFLPLAELPEPVLQRMGESNMVFADDLLARAAFERGAEAKVSFQAQAGARFRQAAGAFLALAGACQRSPDREEDWLDAVWHAGGCEDMAGNYDRAIAHYDLVRSWRTMSDSRGLEAAWRAARCHRAAGRPREAAELYEQVIAASPGHAFAAASLSPLAQCHVTLGQPRKAEAILLKVIDGGAMLEPDAIDYQDALIALADLHYGEGRFRDAIVHYVGALARYRHLDGTAVRQRLAECYWRNARQIDEAIDNEAIIDDQVSVARALREDHLQRAIVLFDGVAKEYAAIEPVDHPLAEESYLRAILGAADCMFDLGRLPQAIERYERAAACFEKDPSSLVALIQIMNCQTALGNVEGAEAARRHARRRVHELSGVETDSAAALFDGDAWRRWLEEPTPLDNPTLAWKGPE